MKKPLLPFALVLLAAACATVPPPTDLLASATQSVKRADASRGDEPSPSELRAARAKLAAANEAMTRGEMLEATRWAEEARLDADLVSIRNEAAKAQFEVDGMRKGNEALRQQALRNAVNVAPIALPMPIAPDRPAPAEGATP